MGQIPRPVPASCTAPTRISGGRGLGGVRVVRSDLNEWNRVSPESFDEGEGVRGEAGGEKPPMSTMRDVIFGVAFQISLQRTGCGVRLVDHADAGRQGSGEKIGDERVVSAAENDAVGRGVEFGQHFGDIPVNECA